MGDDPIIHVRVGDKDGPFPDEEEMRQINEAIRDGLPDYHVVLSTGDISMGEIPALDSYADELAARVSRRVRADSGIDDTLHACEQCGRVLEYDEAEGQFICDECDWAFAPA